MWKKKGLKVGTGHLNTENNKSGRSLKRRKMIRDFIQRQEKKDRLDWQNRLATSEKETRGRVSEWGRCLEASFSASEDTAASSCLYCHTSLEPTDGACSTLKRQFQKIPLFFSFLFLSIASNVDACTMPINMLKLAFRPALRYTQFSFSMCLLWKATFYPQWSPENMGLKLTGRQKQTVNVW